MKDLNYFFKELDGKINNYCCNNTYCGVIHGDSGVILMLSLLYNQTKSRCYLKKMYSILDNISINGNYDFTFGYGVSGLAWTISVVDHNLFINKKSWFKYLNPEIECEYKRMIAQGNIDYFRGASGLLFYFLNIGYKPNNINQLIELYVKVIDEKLYNNGFYQLRLNSNKEYENVLNLGTPHGLCGVILLLLSIKEKGYIIDKKVLNALFDLLINHQFKDNKRYNCNFPSSVINDRDFSTSGLAWCYGDIMIAYSMLKYGQLFDEPDYIRKANVILIDTLNVEKYHSQNLILCHGYTSLSIIYDEIYKKTNNEIFEKAAKKYVNKSLRSFVINYNKYKENGLSSYVFDDPSLFIGYSGFVLTLLYWSNPINTNWTKCLLI